MALSLGCVVRRRQSQRNTTDQGAVLGGDHRRTYVHVCKDSMASQMVRAAGNTFRMRNTRFLRIAAYAEYATGVCDASTSSRCAYLYLDNAFERCKKI